MELITAAHCRQIINKFPHLNRFSRPHKTRLELAIVVVFVYFILYVFRVETKRQKVLNRAITNSPNIIYDYFITNYNFGFTR
jgi:hypothetical protein